VVWAVTAIKTFSVEHTTSFVIPAKIFNIEWGRVNDNHHVAGKDMCEKGVDPPVWFSISMQVSVFE
jgi:hypothetical protein